MLAEFKEKADVLGLEYFAFVGDSTDGTGASVYSASTPESAARNAREAHVERKKKHGIDPKHSRN